MTTPTLPCSEGAPHSLHSRRASSGPWISAGPTMWSSPRPGAHPPNGPPPPGHALQEGHREQGLVGGPGAGSGELVARVWVPGEALRVQARLCGFQRLLHLLAGMSEAPPRLRPCGLDSHRSGSTSLLPRDPCMRASRPGGSLALPQGGHVLFHLTTWAARPAVFQPL